MKITEWLSGKRLPIAIAVLSLSARLLPGARTVDDAYITFRYASNLLAGHGLVYNPGEAVLGTTTPLYALLLAFGGMFTGASEAPFPELALFLNTLADAGTCLILLHLGKQLALPLAGASAALVWAVLPFSVTFAIGGLETSVFVLLITATAALYIHEKYTWAAFLGALSLLTRPDAALLLAPLAADRVILLVRGRHGRGITLSEAGAFVLPIMAWLLPATRFYGSPFPHSVSAKAAAYNLPPEAALTRLIQHYATPFMGNLTFGSAAIMIGIIIYPFLSLIGTWRLIKENSRAWPWLAFPWIWIAAFSIANPLIFRWYLTPPLPAYIFSLLAGLGFVRKDLRAGRKSNALPALVGGLMFLGPVLLLMGAWDLNPDHGPNRPAPEMAYIKLELKYIQAAEFIQPILDAQPETPVLAAADIGALGYFTGVPILDTLGLISPEASSYYPTRPEYHVNAYAVAPDLILDSQPDYIILLEVYGREGLFKNQDFIFAYRPIHTLDTDIYNSNGMLIFERK